MTGANVNTLKFFVKPFATAVTAGRDRAGAAAHLQRSSRVQRRARSLGAALPVCNRAGGGAAVRPAPRARPRPASGHGQDGSPTVTRVAQPMPSGRRGCGCSRQASSMMQAQAADRSLPAPHRWPSIAQPLTDRTAHGGASGSHGGVGCLRAYDHLGAGQEAAPRTRPGGFAVPTGAPPRSALGG